MLKVAVVYHIWPHYRAAVMRAMDRSDLIEYTFISGGKDYHGIKHVDPAAVKRFEVAPYWTLGNLLIQPDVVRLVASGKYDAVICLADLHFVGNWAAALVGRIKHVPVLFWGHGWLRRSRRIKHALQKLYYGLAQHLLIYAERGKRIGIESGFADEKMTVVYNSLDVQSADTVFFDIEAGRLSSINPRDLFADPDLPLLVCVARLTPQCRFDVLLEAAAIMQREGRPVNILLVGEGPERKKLEKMAVKDALNVHFFGACYDEALVGQIIYHADATVSPGKIGLTAMHTLMYGTPAITHNNWNEQMPEVEAVADGKTGMLFEQGNPRALADAIREWLGNGLSREAVRAQCRDEIHRKWSPDIQADIIERVIVGMIGNGR